MSWNTTDELDYINSILNLSYIKELNKNNKIMCIKLDGSRASNLEDDENSDYDITILLDEPGISSNKEFKLRYYIKGRKTHFYLQGIDWFNNKYSDFMSQYIIVFGGLLQYVNFDMKNILYMNPDYEGKILNIIKNKNIFYTQGIYKIYENQDRIIELYFERHNISKDLYPFFQSVKALGCQTDLIPSKKQLLRYKGKNSTIKDQEEQLQFFKNILSVLKNSYNSLLYDHSEELKRILNNE